MTFAAMQAGADLTNEVELLDILKSHELTFKPGNEGMKVHIDGDDATELIRDSRVTANARYMAAAPKVREKLVQMQRQFASEYRAIVTEGRDQGTVAFPDADVKFFLTAEPGERAKRRLTELKQKGISESLDQIQDSIAKRDKSDIERNVGPLKPAQDAIEIDTTGLNIDEVVDKLFRYAEKIIKRADQ